MPKHRLIKQLILTLVAAASAGAACAIGLGSGPSGVVLGQSLDFPISVRLDGDELLNADCVQAEVLLGDQRIAPGSVRTRVLPSGPGAATIRVSTLTTIDEPVVTVQVTAGCGAKVNRRYVVFADPAPSVGAAQLAASPVMLPVVDTASEPANAASLAVTNPSSSPTANAAAQPPAQIGAATQPRRSMLRPEPDVQITPKRGTTQAAAPTERPSRRASAQKKSTAQTPVKSAAKLTSVPQVQAQLTERPRLRLDVAEAAPASLSASAIEDAIEAVSQAASAARAAALAASASADRIASLERSVEAARKQAMVSDAELARLRAEVARPSTGAGLSTSTSNAWLWPLIAFALLVAGAAAWLAWRLRSMRRAQEASWLRASTLAASAAVDAAPAETSPLPLITSALTLQPPAPGASQAVGAVALGAGPRAAGIHSGGGHQSELTPAPHAPKAAELPRRSGAVAGATDAGEPLFVHAMARTIVLPPSAKVDEGAPRDVSIEELIDVDQQAEFFIALGQDTAAIDLLVAHLRNTGGGSPLTYLKLLEIYRRRDDQPAYERTRSRFNQRYNAYAPEWGADLTLGKSLEDYPEVSPRLQQAWGRPLDAMAELEALLFRKSRGELFDLPAYREVLFLYSLARDLLERDSADKNQVDLLLPLELGQTAGAAVVGNSRAGSEISFDDHPTAPVDLDLTPPKARDSIFGELLSPTSGSLRRR